MTAATVSGTHEQPPTGFAFTPGQPTCTLEPGRGLTCTVRVQAGAAIERIAVDSTDEPIAGASWRQYREGEEFTVREGRRILMRPRGSGGGGVTFHWKRR